MNQREEILNKNQDDINKLLENLEKQESNLVKQKSENESKRYRKLTKLKQEKAREFFDMKMFHENEI